MNPTEYSREGLPKYKKANKNGYYIVLVFKLVNIKDTLLIYSLETA